MSVCAVSSGPPLSHHIIPNRHPLFFPLHTPCNDYNTMNIHRQLEKSKTHGKGNKNYKSTFMQQPTLYNSYNSISLLHPSPYIRTMLTDLSLFPAVPCTRYASGWCEYGDECWFIHYRDESLYKPPNPTTVVPAPPLNNNNSMEPSSSFDMTGFTAGLPSLTIPVQLSRTKRSKCHYLVQLFGLGFLLTTAFRSATLFRFSTTQLFQRRFLPLVRTTRRLRRCVADSFPVFVQPPRRFSKKSHIFSIRPHLP